MIPALTRFSFFTLSVAVLSAQPTGYLASARPGNGFVQYLSIPSYKPIGRTQTPPEAQTTLFSPDGTRIYVLSNVNINAIPVGPVQVVTIINSSTFATINSVALPAGYYRQMVITPDGKKLFIAGVNGIFVSLNTVSFAVSTPVQFGGLGTPSISASSDGTRVWIAEQDLFAVDTATDTVVGDFPLAGQIVSQVVASPKGKAVYTLSTDSTGLNPQVALFNPVSSKFGKISQLPGFIYVGVAISHTGSTLYALTNFGGDIVTIDAATFGTATFSVGGTVQPSAISTSPDGTHLYVAGGSTVYVLNSALSVVGTIPQTSPVYYLAVNPAGTQLLATNYATSTIQSFNAATLALGPQTTLGYDPVGFAFFLGDNFEPQLFPVVSPDGKTIYSANGLSINFVDSATMKVSGKFTSSVPVTTLALTPDGRSLFAGNSNCGIQQIDTATRTVVQNISPPCDSSINLVVSPDGRWLYGPGPGGGLGIYDINASLSLSGSLPTVVGLLSLSHDGKTLYVVSPSPASIITTVDTASRTVSTPITISGGTVGLVVPSPVADIAYILTTSPNSITVLNTVNNTVTGPLAAGISDALNVGFTPDGNHAWLVTREGQLVEVQTSTGLLTGQTSFPAIQPGAILFQP